MTGFELVWLRELGYSPRLDACATCGNDVAAGAFFSPSAGGAMCLTCGPAASDRRWLSPSALTAMRELTADAESDGLVSPDVTATVRAELRQVLGQTVSFVLGRRPRLLGYVDGQ